MQVGAMAIVAPTSTGKTARRVSKYRPPLPIIAMSSRRKVQRQLLLSWGVHPIACREFDSIETIFRESEGAVVRLGMAGRGDRIAIVAGGPQREAGGEGKKKRKKTWRLCSREEDTSGGTFFRN